MTDYAITRWRDPDWLGRAAGWASDRLAERGHSTVG
jgi:hypothetical protein